MKKLNLKKENLLIAYKLLHDALLLFLIAFTAMLLGEGLLPGFVSARLSFYKIVIAIVVILLSIAWLGAKLNITYHAPKLKGNKLLPALVLISFLLIGNSMLRFDLWANLIITITFLFVLYLIYLVLEEN